MTPTCIRPAVPADADLILGLIRELARYEHLDGDVDCTPDLLAAALFGNAPKVFCDIVEWEGTAAGFAVWFYNFSTFRGRHGIYLEDLFVRADHRGRGPRQGAAPAPRPTLRRRAARQIGVVRPRLEHAVHRLLPGAGGRPARGLDDLPGHRRRPVEPGRSMTVPLVLIAAVGRNGAIGLANRLPWRLKSDLQHFRAATMGKPVIMGRKTFQSIGRPLAGRHLVVVSGGGSIEPQLGVDVRRTLDEALAMAESIALARSVPEIMVAGGAAIYEQTIERASRLELTEVELDPPADAWFPRVDRALWRETRREARASGPEDDAGFSFVTLERR